MPVVAAAAIALVIREGSIHFPNTFFFAWKTINYSFLFSLTGFAKATTPGLQFCSPQTRRCTNTYLPHFLLKNFFNSIDIHVMFFSIIDFILLMTMVSISAVVYLEQNCLNCGFLLRSCLVHADYLLVYRVQWGRNVVANAVLWLRSPGRFQSCIWKPAFVTAGTPSVTLLYMSNFKIWLSWRSPR